MSGSRFKITVEELNTINEAQERESNKNNFDEIGDVELLADFLDSDTEYGISENDDLKDRIEKFGSNKLPEPKMLSWFELFIEAFDDATVIVLMISAIISLIVGIYHNPSKGWIEGTAILIAVLIVAIVTATNDYEKELQFRQLNAVKDNTLVKVIRGGILEEIYSNEVVVGDLIVLEPGDKVPADGVYIIGDNAICNEASLTGETEEKRKNHKTDPFLLSGCQLTSGTCRILIIAVGKNSQWGKIRSKLSTGQNDTPLQEKLDKLANLIGYIGMGAAVATFLAMLIVFFFTHPRELWWSSELVDEILDAFIMAVTIVVVAVPEGLPLAVTISLAYSTKKMLKDNNLIRVLAACETMGNATNICSDKTGTLTENRMTVVEGWFGGVFFDTIPNENDLSDEVKNLLSEGISVNTSAVLHDDSKSNNLLNNYHVIGNKTEGALLMLLKDMNINYEIIRTNSINLNHGDKIFSFTSKRKAMSTLIHGHPSSPLKSLRKKHNNNKKSTKKIHSNHLTAPRLYCKGAPEILIERAIGYTNQDGITIKLTKKYKNKLLDIVNEMASKALRTVCMAHRDFDEQLPEEYLTTEYLEDEFIIDGIVGIMDPLREDVCESVKTCQEAGITVRMVTGDKLETAVAIGKNSGILTENGIALEGPEFRHMTPKELDNILPNLQILARSSPDDKHILVTRLNGVALPKTKEEWEEIHPGHDYYKERDLLLPGYYDEWKISRNSVGEVVGVTGDGTNDAPALHAADVGLSMGISGTDVAKEASDIVIMDDKFSSIVKAVLWGRTVFDNIRKFLQFQLTVNIVALTVTFISSFTGFDPPLNAVMMLWVNLIMDTMGALALGTETPSLIMLKRKPYKRNANLVNRVMWRNILIQSLYQIVLLVWLLYEGDDLFNLVEGSDHHSTFLFNTFVFCQIFNEFNARNINSDINIFHKITGNPIFILIIVLTIVIQYFLVEYGGDFTGTESLSYDHWFYSILFGFLTLPLGVFMRFIPIKESMKNFAITTEQKELNENNKNKENNNIIMTLFSCIMIIIIMTVPIMSFRLKLIEF